MVILTLICCRYKEMSLIKDLMSLSCSLNFFSASSKASSLIWEKDVFSVFPPLDRKKNLFAYSSNIPEVKCL